MEGRQTGEKESTVASRRAGRNPARVDPDGFDAAILQFPERRKPAPPEANDHDLGLLGAH